MTLAKKYAEGDPQIEEAIEKLRNADNPLRGITKSTLRKYKVDPEIARADMDSYEYTNDIAWLM